MISVLSVWLVQSGDSMRNVARHTTLRIMYIM